MTTHEPLTDIELEAMLARLTTRGRPDGLEASIMAAVDATPQGRRPWLRWPDWRVAPAPERRLVWLLAILGLLLALVASAAIIGARLIESTPPRPIQLPELLEGMVTEEVEPGVLRIVNDGVRDLTPPADSWGFTVDVTPDGSVWLSSTGGVRQGLFRLGEEPVFEFPSSSPRWPPYLEVASDGSLWARGGVPDDRDGIFSVDGEGWTMRATANDIAALAIGPDEMVWVVGTDLMRLEDDGSLTAVEGWDDAYQVSPDEVAVSPDGDVWLMGFRRDDPAADVLLRFDGEGWDAIPPPAGWESQGPRIRRLGFDLDGALWVNTSGPEVNTRAPILGGLARFDDPGWTVFTEADGVEPWGGEPWESCGGRESTDLFAVAPDGSFWLNGRGSCGVAHWDGTTWTSYLVDYDIFDLAVAPDGSVWLRAALPHHDPYMGFQTLVIPAAGATTE